MLRMLLHAWLVALGITSVSFVALVLCQGVARKVSGVVWPPRRADVPKALPGQRVPERESERSSALADR